MGDKTWEQALVGDLFDMQLGKKLNRAAKLGISPYPYLANRNVQWECVDLSSLEWMDFSAAERLKYKLLPGDLLVCEGGEVGRTALWKGELDNCFFQMAIHRLRVRDERIIPEFMLRFMRIATQTGLLRNFTSQTSIAHLTQEQLALLNVPVPPLIEQRYIAQILDTIDVVINETEKIISKLRQVKEGLLDKIFTRGIDANGNLRNEGDQPEDFKESLLGKIPKNWEVVLLEDVITTADYGISSALSTRGEVPVLRMHNLSAGEVDLSDLKYASWSAVGGLILRPGEVLFNRTNSIDHVGRTGIWRGQLECASFASYLVRLNYDVNRLSGEFLNCWLNLPETQRVIREFATPGVHQVNISPKNLLKVKIALPGSLLEQQNIVAIVQAHNDRLNQEDTFLNKQRLIKQGLMSDLITGRMRVGQATEVSS
jgi:type I restriction enzyme S subunit